MPDLLGATNPVPGYDGAARNRSQPISPNDTQIQNIPDPSRVGRPDGRNEKQDAGGDVKNSLPRYDSNFQTFLQRLQNAPDLTATLSRLLTGRTGMLVTSGMGAGIAEELAQFLEMLHMDQAQLLQFLTEQTQSGSRFQGPLFNLLRDALHSADSEGVRADILQFLKRYSDYSSTEHIEGNLLRTLNQMVRSVPSRWASKLIDLAAQLQNGISAGDRAGNLKLLQGEIIPHLANYVERTHDMGRARGLLTYLMLDISRYENGSEEGLLQAFHQLKNYGPLRDKLGLLDDQALLNLLKNTAFAKAAQGDAFAAHLAAAADLALRGGSGLDAQNAFRELVSAFLINESVYMNINHLLIPLEWDGKMMFSELWVDPDAEQEGGSEEDTGRTLRFLFKLDIQSLGFFDMVLTSRNQSVDLQIHCPDRVAAFSPVIEGALKKILTQHDLKVEGIQVKRMERPLSVSEIFPKIYEGKDCVDVKV